MFPDRSRRVITDGVTNQFQLHGERILETDYVDTPKVIDGFFEECAKAGPGCALSAFANATDDLTSKVLGVVDRLREEPLSARERFGPRPLFRCPCRRCAWPRMRGTF
ncbi:hypothetical protein J3459_006777 [Metarhizium acridum]|uniref:uncharacterized protein n=1 Tax=Metarhizium acridum TaxID=92637 RepID=UPI001C6C5301|nr:hypothetical protein J3458_019200 [Metarhizium acridum]KAG8427382.1 hypothetical protein J3459_006777 [Metarhizium acridum]